MLRFSQNQLHNLDYSCFKVLLTFMYCPPSGIYSTRYLSSYVSISLYHTSPNPFLPIMLDLPPEILLATAFRIRDAVQKNIESIYRLYPELRPTQPVDPSKFARAQEAALASVALSKSAGPDLVSTTQSIRSSDEVEAALALVALSHSAGLDIVSPTQLDSSELAMMQEAALALVALSQSAGPDLVSPTQPVEPSDEVKAALALVALKFSQPDQRTGQ